MLSGSVFKAYKLITLTCIILFIYVGDYNDITILPLTQYKLIKLPLKFLFFILSL